MIRIVGCVVVVNDEPYDHIICNRTKVEVSTQSCTVLKNFSRVLVAVKIGCIVMSYVVRPPEIVPGGRVTAKRSTISTPCRICRRGTEDKEHVLNEERTTNG